jgi:hypothetical protein
VISAAHCQGQFVLDLGVNFHADALRGHYPYLLRRVHGRLHHSILIGLSAENYFVDKDSGEIASPQVGGGAQFAGRAASAWEFLLYSRLTEMDEQHFVPGSAI